MLTQCVIIYLLLSFDRTSLSSWNNNARPNR